MVSGWSLTGGRPACYPFFQELYICYALSDNPGVDCQLQREDYDECRTRRKESQRIQTIIDHQKEKEKLLKSKNSTAIGSRLST